MFLIRCVSTQDLPRLMDLARQASHGLTTLPPQEDLLAKTIAAARRALDAPTDAPSGARWLFALQDSDSGLVQGVCGIHDKTGGYQPFWTYRVQTVHRESRRFGISRDLQTLHLEQVHDGPSEIGSLFLAPSCRRQGAGRVLSLARFMHIANHPQRFESQIIAEMRGVIDETGRSPFWESLGRHFFHLDFPQADRLSFADKSFIADLIPQHPIYVCLLASEAQEVIGMVHPRTRPAQELLVQEGFSPTGQIDVFDGGPVLGCAQEDIACIRRSRCGPLLPTQAKDEDGPATHLVARPEADLRLVACRPQIDPEGIALSPQARDLLQVSPGQRLRWSSLRAAIEGVE